MTPEMRSLFHELADLTPSERERVLKDRKIGPELRAEVESLLRFDSTQAPDFSDSVASVAGEILGSACAGPAVYCGAYRLVRLIGSGGMGTVYLAERSDGEIQQRVAVKLVGTQGQRPGWRERFFRERQLLASLNHPAIVRVIDAGRTEGGRPYLVMEYVHGVPIDQYAGRIGLRDKLQLFLRVSDAIAYAHHHLIVHRDLKPSNILVEASGQPKLLDFGIAKLIDETGDPTLTVERLLTPGYASPEQLRGEPQTASTDVYSLGAVLFKLLTGQSPHESRSGTAHALEVAAGEREVPSARNLNRDLPADLDYILAKALRVEPHERYASVDALAGDIRAFLEFRPVQARSGNAWYRTRKFLRRYWVPVAAAAVVLASLSAGLYVVNRERSIAQRRFQDVRQLANKLFDIDLQARQLPGGAKTRQVIVDTALEYLRRLGSEVHGDPELTLEMANAYMRVARVQGVPISPSLGRTDEAEENLRIAERLAHSVIAAQPGNRTALLRAAQIAHDRMLLAGLQHRNSDALALARESEQWLNKFQARKSDRPEDSAILNTYLNVADRYRQEGRHADSLRLVRRGVDLARLFDWPAALGTFLRVSAQVHRDLGDLDPALADIREALKLLDPHAKDIGEVANYIQTTVYESNILGGAEQVNLGRDEEALQSALSAFRLADPLVHQAPDNHTIRGDLALAAISIAVLQRSSNARSALDICDHTLRHLAETPGDTHLEEYEARLLAESSYALRRLGRDREARQRLDAALQRLKQLKLYPLDHRDSNANTAPVLRALADYQAASGETDRAVGVYQELLNQATKSGPPPDLTESFHLSTIYAGAAAAYRAAKRDDLARRMDEQRAELWRKWDARLPNNSFVRRQLETATR